MSQELELAAAPVFTFEEERASGFNFTPELEFLAFTLVPTWARIQRCWNSWVLSDWPMWMQ